MTLSTERTSVRCFHRAVRELTVSFPSPDGGVLREPFRCASTIEKVRGSNAHLQRLVSLVMDRTVFLNIAAPLSEQIHREGEGMS